MKSRNGSATVQAAMIFPVLILIVAGMISIGLSMYEDVKSDSQLHRDEMLSEVNAGGIDISLIMRGKWILK